MKFSIINFCFLIIIIHSSYGYKNVTEFHAKIENLNETLKLDRGDLLKCQVNNVIYKKHNQHEDGLTIIQLNQTQPTFFPLKYGQDCFTFLVKQDPEPIIINLFSMGDIKSYVAVMGKFNKTTNEIESFLYENGTLLNKIIHYDHIVNDFNFTRVSISLNRGISIVLNSYQQNSTLAYNTSQQYISHIGILGEANKVELFIHREPTCSKDRPTVNGTKTAEIYCESFKNNKDNSTNNQTEANIILIQKDLYSQIYLDSRTFNLTSEGTGNSSNNLYGNSTNISYAKRHLDELDSLFAYAKSNHEQIMRNPYLQGKTEYINDLIYVQIKWQYFNYLKSVLDKIGN